VERILAAKGGTGISACASAATQTRLSVSQWEREIDERVYGLTPEEIKIVEYASAKATAGKGEKWTWR